MLTNKIIINKFYLYKGKVVKVRKVHKVSGKVFLQFIEEGSEEIIPLNGGDLLLARLYTIGELAKITGKRTDTIRKYEKVGLLLHPDFYFESENSYKNWRFYRESEVHDVLSFFSSRTPGRPVVQGEVDIRKNIISLKKKVANL